MNWHRSIEKKHYSQNGEDGIIAYLCSRINIVNKNFVEIGASSPDGVENNTRLLLDHGWSGVWIDKRYIGYRNPNLTIINEFVTIDNVSKILGGVPPFDLLGIDIDSNDYWIWDAIPNKPAITIMEYNACMGPNKSVVVAYEPTLTWSCTDYFGASLAALHKLAIKKGYSLVGCDSRGVNAFFVRDDLVGDMKPLTPQEAFVPFGYPLFPQDARKMIEI